MTVAEAVRAGSAPLLGHPAPRVGPPLPVRSDLAGFRKHAERMNLTLMPWQETSARYLTALDADNLHLYREVCIVVARQNGKTTLMQPYIIGLLRDGKRVMHIAQTRELPRVMFGLVADSLEAELFPKRRGKGGNLQTVWPRFGSGQEEILLNNGGCYRISAANRGSSRGWTNDVVIIDELREMETFDVISAAEPTLKTSPDPQIVYLSNAGTDQSVVLNSIRARAGDDESLAYLEWSAAPERSADDVEGWAEANPAIGHIPSALKSLEHDYRKHKLAGTMSIFETEDLCRWVVTMRERLVDEFAWMRCKADDLEKARRPMMGIAVDPGGRRVSAALAWMRPDSTIGLRLAYDVTLEPDSLYDLGKDISRTAMKLGVANVGYDPLTDALLAKHFRKSEPMSGQKFAWSSSQFVNAVNGARIAWADVDGVTDDLTWTARKSVSDDRGAFEAVRSSDDHPITAALAAIRAVGLASGPRPSIPKVM